MTLAYWCILIAALLPMVWVAVAKTGAPRYNNRDPRSWVAKQEIPRVQRGYAAHLNALEAFAPFAAGVVMAQLAGVDPQRIGWLALAFIVFRVLHGLFYLSGTHYARSLVWLGGFACVLGLMGFAATKVAV